MDGRINIHEGYAEHNLQQRRNGKDSCDCDEEVGEGGIPESETSRFWPAAPYQETEPVHQEAEEDDVREADDEGVDEARCICTEAVL
jgi:hypothetical protein